jgi:hypothetical protein
VKGRRGLRGRGRGEDAVKNIIFYKAHIIIVKTFLYANENKFKTNV